MPMSARRRLVGWPALGLRIVCGTDGVRMMMNVMKAWRSSGDRRRLDNVEHEMYRQKGLNADRREP